MKQDEFSQIAQKSEKLWKTLIPNLTPGLEESPASEKFWKDYEQLITQNKATQAQSKSTSITPTQDAPLIAQVFDKYWPSNNKVITMERKIKFGWTYIMFALALCSSFVFALSSTFDSGLPRSESVLSHISMIILVLTITLGAILFFTEEANALHIYDLVLKPNHFILEVKSKKRVSKYKAFYHDIYAVEKTNIGFEIQAHHTQVLKGKEPPNSALIIPKNTTEFTNLKLFFEDLMAIEYNW